MYIVDTCEIVELPTRPILNNNAVVTANARALAFACSCSQFIRCYLCDAAAAAAIIIWECGVAVRAHHRHSYYAIQQEQEHLIDGYNTHLLYVPYILFALCWMCIYGLSVFQIASQSVSRMPMPDSILNGVYASVVDDEQMCAAAAVTAGEFPFSSCVCVVVARRAKIDSFHMQMKPMQMFCQEKLRSFYMIVGYRHSSET